MRFRKVTIFKHLSGEVVREIELQPGVNFIVDETLGLNETSGNNVGKTTFLKLINVLMGSKDKKYLYLDKDTGNQETSLLNRIETEKLVVSAELIFEGNETDSIELEVELFTRGKHRINGKSYSLSNYHKELNRLLFGNVKNVPTFRQLIQAFVRVKMDSETDKFLRYLEHTSNEQYRAIYNYLFETADSALDVERDQLRSMLRKTEEAAKEFKRIDNATEKRSLTQLISSTRQMAKSVETEVLKLEFQMSDIVNATIFEENKVRIQEVRRQYSNFSDEIAELSFKRARHIESIRAMKNQTRVSLEDSEVKNFFDEMKELIPDVTKTFDELLAFNRKIQSNKIHYLQTVVDSYNGRIDEIKDKQTKLVSNNAELMSLVTDDNLLKYEKLSHDIANRRAELITLTNKISEYEKFQSRIQDLKKTLADSQKSQKNDETSQEQITDIMVEFNSYFTAYSEKLNGARPFLVYNFQEEQNGFPVHVEAIESLSKGTKKAMIAAYDLAYQSFAKLHNKKVPGFFVHDVMENIDGTTLQNLIDLVNGIGSQFIFAVLREKLISSGVENDVINEHTVLSLSKESRLFGD